MVATLSKAQRARLRERGMALLTVGEGLALLDEAIQSDEPVVLAARLDREALGERWAGALPPLLRSLAEPMRGRGAVRKARQAAGALARELASLDNAQKRDLITLTRTSSLRCLA
jgi:polyketide synthase 7